jgi:hypothetical protein
MDCLLISFGLCLVQVPLDGPVQHWNHKDWRSALIRASPHCALATELNQALVASWLRNGHPTVCLPVLPVTSYQLAMSGSLIQELAHVCLLTYVFNSLLQGDTVSQSQEPLAVVRQQSTPVNHSS